MKIIEGNLIGKGLKIGIVVARFNEFITNKLLFGALDALKRHEVDENNIDVTWVPGSFEIPLLAKKMAISHKYDAIITLGALIRGETPHFDYIANETSKGIASITLQSEIPVIFGILTTNTLEQAIQRAGAKVGNKGWDSAVNAIEMANILKQFNSE